MSSPRKSSRISLAAILTLLTGVAVTGLLFVAVSALEYSKMELSFQQRGHMRAAAIRRGMDDTLELVTIINTLFKTAGVVEREQFATFTRPLLERYPFVQAFNFHRVLDHAGALRAQDLELRAGLVVLGQLGDGLEELAAPVVVEVLREQPLRARGEPAADVVAEAGEHPGARQVDVQPVGLEGDGAHRTS